MEQRGGSVPTRDQIKHWPESEERPPTPASVWLFSGNSLSPAELCGGAVGWSDASHYSNPPAIPSPLSSAKAETAVSPSQRCHEVEAHTTLLYDAWGTVA